MADTRDQRTIDQLKQQVETLETRLKKMTEWLEKNQPDVWRRGFWDSIN